MLRFLRIRNLAVIEAVEVDFETGFNVLTGETGAGKSILVEAVGLLLGGRASADLVRTGTPLATIEALFEDEDGSELVVRREISSQGRSRSFVNGELATAATLRELSQRLVELHGQHEHQALLDPATHLALVDEYAGLGRCASEVAEAWGRVRVLRDQLERSRMDSREKAARLELVGVQLAEIEKVAPKPGEDEALASTKQVLASAERIHRLCGESYAALYESDQAVLGALAGVWKRVGELATIDPQFAPYVDARAAIKAQLEDLAFFLRSYAEDVDASPARLQQVEDRLADLERLKRKYGPTLGDVLGKGADLARERDLLSGKGESTEQIQRDLETASDAYLTVARGLSARRRTAAGALAAALEALLAELAMTDTRVEMRFNEQEPPADAWGERGIDQAELYLSPNPGEALRPLVRIVSGGELSRVMLAVKTIGARRSTGHATGAPAPAGVRTLVFDEVDAGIGGRVADVVGATLRGLAGDFQVLCITHLPQIAARATTQFLIQKRVVSGRTVTDVARLDREARIEEVARMLGGSHVTDAVRATAGELIHGAKGKQKAKGERRKRKSTSWLRNI